MSNANFSYSFVMSPLTFLYFYQQHVTSPKLLRDIFFEILGIVSQLE